MLVGQSFEYSGEGALTGNIHTGTLATVYPVQTQEECPQSHPFLNAQRPQGPYSTALCHYPSPKAETLSLSACRPLPTDPRCSALAPPGTHRIYPVPCSTEALLCLHTPSLTSSFSHHTLPPPAGLLTHWSFVLPRKGKHGEGGIMFSPLSLLLPGTVPSTHRRSIHFYIKTENALV